MWDLHSPPHFYCLETTLKKIVLIALVLLSGCVVQPPTRVVYVQAPPPPLDVYRIPAPLPVVSIYVEPPLYQPPPIRIAWAPPPMLVEVPPPFPYLGAVWTGGYWVWEGNWVWARGRWIAPPHPDYAWVNPYYEHRAGSVIFVNGFWAAPGVSFVAPSFNLNIAFGVVAAGIVAGSRPIGPEGVFIPAPPGSYTGLIVPAPIGTAPAVVTGAPPIIRTGMRVNIVNNNTVTTNNVTNITNVTIVAPASATANGQAVNTAIPAQPHLAAAMPSVVRALAPVPASAKPIPALVPGRAAIVLPTAQMVHPDMLPAALHQHALVQGQRPPATQGVFSPQPIPLTAPYAAASAAPTSQIPHTSASRSPEPVATIGKQELKSTDANTPFKTDITASRDGNATASSVARRVASEPANNVELRQPNTTRGPAAAPSNSKAARPAPVTNPPARSDNAPQGKPVTRPEVKRLEVKKPSEAEKAAEKHPHE